jgi:hypothetical protein
MNVEIIKAYIEIVKIKLVYFSSVLAGSAFIFLNFEKVVKFLNEYLIYLFLLILFIYGIIGIMKNLIELNSYKIKLGETK